MCVMHRFCNLQRLNFNLKFILNSYRQFSIKQRSMKYNFNKIISIKCHPQTNLKTVHLVMSYRIQGILQRMEHMIITECAKIQGFRWLGREFKWFVCKTEWFMMDSYTIKHGSIHDYKTLKRTNFTFFTNVQCHCPSLFSN